MSIRLYVRNNHHHRIPIRGSGMGMELVVSSKVTAVPNHMRNVSHIRFVSFCGSKKVSDGRT